MTKNEATRAMLNLIEADGIMGPELLKRNIRITLKLHAEAYYQEKTGAEDGTPDNFEKDLFGLINRYVKKGLKKADLVKKMKWATGIVKHLKSIK